MRKFRARPEQTGRSDSYGVSAPATLIKVRFHDPGKIVTDLAVAVALGGDCLADVAVLRAQPALSGPVASDPVVSRLIARLAADAPRALKAIRARAGRCAGTGLGAGRRHCARRRWQPGHRRHRRDDRDRALGEGPGQRPTWKKTFGFHPLTVFADHGPDGSRASRWPSCCGPGTPGPNTAADHIEATRLALAQLPPAARRQVLIRADSGGGTHDFLTWLAKPGRRLAYSVGFTITDDIAGRHPGKIPATAWTPAYDSDGQVRDGAWVAELTGMLDLSAWPKGMRVIVRKERPHPGAQLRFTDIDGHRFTCFATSTRGGQLADLELRHRRRARCEDRIRNAKDTGLRNLPLHGYAQNQIWCEIAALACELLAWMQMLALPGPARRWEPKRLRLRIFAVPGAWSAAAAACGCASAAPWPWATADHRRPSARLQALAPG